MQTLPQSPRLASVLLASLVVTLFACGREDDAGLAPVKDPWQSPGMELEPGCGEADAGPATDAGPSEPDAGPPEPDAGSALCGDAIKHPSEECDDGNYNLGDGCTPLCKREPRCLNGSCEARCGDGRLEPNSSEACDDGNTVAHDGCSPTCQLEPGFLCQVLEAPPPSALELPIVYRDFRGYDLPATGGLPRGHIDFQNKNGSERGIVASTLGPDNKPVYAKVGVSSLTTHGQYAFDQWFRDVPNVNLPLVGNLQLTRTPDNEYLYDNAFFFPLDNAGWVAAGQEPLRNDYGAPARPRNFSFTSETRHWFQYNGTEVIRFRGDDDVWVFVNGRLALDLGGIHGPETGSVSLAALATPLGLNVGGVYQLAVFQAERHTTGSSYRLGLQNFHYPRQYTACIPHPQLLCGNGTVDPGEQCDDGVNDGGYGQCAAGCIFGPRCGDGVVQLSSGEQCDDGNLNSQDGCSAYCQLELF
ncbi:fibro-slime domain-containing protein [Myxococcus sp. MISCRS1]|uniref:fibro-slime domain-containing protein n=1 Tax=Myxococcus sp. MISCRS1 TaxID=2996786 RepID=UPI00226E1A75|nr:fibro-slime domain-containing protein [Myxococcus sp. MISCRS1]MCY1000700.1 fibro-slime domain-containing protein [Myxococcus sp. MISCRS1]